MRRLLPVLSLVILAACGGGSATPPQVTIPPTPALIVGVGDSIMAGSYNSAGTYITSNSYLVLAGKADGLATNDQATPGATSQYMLANEVPNIPAKTTLVVITDGTNDVQASLPVSSFDALVVGVMAAAPNANLIFVTEKPFISGLGVDYTTQMQAWSNEMKAEASRVGASVLDVGSSQMDPADFFDNVHLTTQGATVVAAMLAPLI